MTNPNTPTSETALLPIREDVARDLGSTAFIPTVDPASRQGQFNLLRDLEPVVTENLNRHYRVQKEWFSHDYIPWDKGRNFAAKGGEDWDISQSEITPPARTAMVVNLLTEDNLPSYHREIATRFGLDGPWGQWVGRWTAEEGQHGIALRDYLVVTRAVDPVRLERLRVRQMTAGYSGAQRSDLETIAYVTFQELATRVSHRNTGKIAGDPDAENLLARIAQDENLHMLFYRNLVQAAFERAPNETMRAVTSELLDFQMPGEGMPDYARDAVTIAKAGIYDMNLHLRAVVEPTLKYWDTDHLALSGDGDKAREELKAFLALTETQVSRSMGQRDSTRAKLAAAGRSLLYLDGKSNLVRIDGDDTSSKPATS